MTVVPTAIFQISIFSAGNTVKDTSGLYQWLKSCASSPASPPPSLRAVIGAVKVPSCLLGDAFVTSHLASEKKPPMLLPAV